MKNLIAEMTNLGLKITEPILNGQIQRTSVVGKAGNSGWYVGMMLSGKVFATYGRWDTGDKKRFGDDNHEISVADSIVILEMNERIEEEKIKKHKKASQIAKKMYENAKAGEHEYLTKKQAKHHNSRIYNNMLLVPIYDRSKIVNLQRIYPDGSKKFLYGGQVIGCASRIPGSGKIAVCEGFSTGSSIHQATGFTVLIAFNAMNLVHVAKLVRKRNPNDEIIICADNDKFVEKLGYCPGERFGREAAKAGDAGFVMPSEIGKDFNDIHCKYGIKAVRYYFESRPDGICTIEDFESGFSISLDIPERLYNIPGLISDGMQAAIAAGAPDIVQYNFPTVLSIIARSIASKLSCQGVWPNVYNIKVGGTSTGKTDVDQVFKLAFSRSGIDNFYGPTDFSSGPGLLRGMSDSFPQCLVTLDEVSFLFKRTKDDTNAAGKISALLELYTCNGADINKPYGDSNKVINIKNPCLILTGNSTPDIFDNIRIEDMTTGLMQRFDFWCYDGKIPYRTVPEYSNPTLTKFVSGLVNIFQSVAPQKNPHDLTGLISNYDLTISKQVKKMLKDYSHEIIDAANEIRDDEGVKGLISRRYYLAIKYAMIHMAAIRPVKAIYDPMQEENLLWGIEVAKLLCEWKINTLTKRLTAGEFHKDCEIFKDAIVAAIRAKRKPTIKALCERKRRLNELKPRDIGDIVSTLAGRGEIIVDETGRKTVYHLKKD